MTFLLLLKIPYSNYTTYQKLYDINIRKEPERSAVSPHHNSGAWQAHWTEVLQIHVVQKKLGPLSAWVWWAYMLHVVLEYLYTYMYLPLIQATCSGIYSIYGAFGA